MAAEGSKGEKEICAADTCNLREILTIDGKCQKCPDYTEAKDKRTCLKVRCSDANFVLTPEAKCEKCPEHTKADRHSVDC